MNPLESDNKLVTYCSWFASPLLDQAFFSLHEILFYNLLIYALVCGTGVPP